MNQKKQQKKKKRKKKIEQTNLNEYSLLKVIATILVVFAHITIMYTDLGVINPANDSWGLSYITKLIYSYHMPLFVFISGAIYYYLRQEKGKYSNFKNFVSNKAKRLMLPYMIFGILYVAPVMIGFGFTTDNFFSYVANGILLSTNSRHLWYLFCLFNIFIIFYGAEIYVKKLPAVIKVAALFIIYMMYLEVPNIFQLRATAQYLIYFYLGYLFQRNKKSIDLKMKSKYMIFILTVTLNVFILHISSSYRIKGNMMQIMALISAISGITAIYYFSKILLKTKIMETKIYKILSNDSFGIYIYHPMIIYILYFYLRNQEINPLFMTSFIFISTMIISDALTRVTRKLGLGFLM